MHAILYAVAGEVYRIPRMNAAVKRGVARQMWCGCVSGL